MKKVTLLLMVLAILVAFYNQVSNERNIYLTAAAIGVFMFGMMRLSAKTPSKNQEKENEDV